jgi:hypothetical protein
MGWDNFTPLKSLIPNFFRGAGARGDSYDYNNDLGRKVNLVGDHDDVTHITFGAFGQSYSYDGLLGIIAIVVCLGCMLCILNFATGARLAYNCWGVWLFVALHHILSESGIEGTAIFFLRALPLVVFAAKLVEVTWVGRSASTIVTRSTHRLARLSATPDTMTLKSEASSPINVSDS